MASNYQVLTTIPGGTDEPMGPYLIPPMFPQSGRPPLAISVAYVSGGAPQTTACTIATGGANTDFSLAWTPGPPPTARVTVQPTHVYSNQPADRAALLASFNAFCVELEKMELDSASQCLAPGGAGAIASAVAGSLPLRLDEVLTYQYGLAPGSNQIDLVPGMRLRFDTGGYDFVAPSSAWNGFGASGGAGCTVARSSTQDTYFDGFLNRMQTSVPLGTPAWIGGPADLAALGPRRHLRLVYPRSAAGPTQTSAAPAFGRTPALLGADTLTDLDAATAAYFKDGGCVTGTGSRPVLAAAFAGRTAVVPEIPVKFLGQWRYLPAGSTVQNLLDLYSPLCASQFPAPNVSNNLVFNRLNIAGLAADPAFGRALVTFSRTTVYLSQPEGGPLSQWDLPLLAGDGFAMATEAAS